VFGKYSGFLSKQRRSWFKWQLWYRKVPGSNLGRSQNYSDFSEFPQSLQANTGLMHQTGQRPFPSVSFSIQATVVPIRTLRKCLHVAHDVNSCFMLFSE
jgi:hypothetical protein